MKRLAPYPKLLILLLLMWANGFMHAQTQKIKLDKSLRAEAISVSDSLTIPDFADSTGIHEKQMAINSTVVFNSNTEMIPLEHCDLRHAHDTCLITISNIAIGLDIDVILLIKGNSYRSYVYYNAVNIGELRQFTVLSSQLLLNHLPSERSQPLVGRLELQFSGSYFDIELNKETLVGGSIGGMFRAE